MTPTLSPTAPLTPPSAQDRCDRCSARAIVRIVLAGGGDLVFCSHHARKYDVQLRELAAHVLRAETDAE